MIAAIVPAAGRSERMGRPKLLLPIDGVIVIARVIDALRQGGADPVIVVVPPAEVPGAAALAAAAERAGACVVVADPPPPDMRASVERGLDRLAQLSGSHSTLLLVPGDSPGIDAPLVARIIARAGEEPHSIIVPSSRGRRGHPIALPRSVLAEIRDLPAEVGINALVARHAGAVVELDVDDPDALADLDTPEDYRRWAPRLMRVNVRLFALAKQRAGRAEIAVDVPEPATVAGLKAAMAAASPALAPLIPQLMIAIDADYALDDQRLIPRGAEVAAIPPVSGGSLPRSTDPRPSP